MASSTSIQEVLQQKISISIVSHYQAKLVQSLLEDIRQYCSGISIEVILTVNVDEPLSFDLSEFEFSIRIIRNISPMGFAANHNQAFIYASGQYFCVMNPDIRIDGDPFVALLMCLKNSAVGVAAPMVISGDGKMEDSARYFPSPLKILCKLFGRCKGSDYVIGELPVYPDWVGGMFMVFPAKVYREIGGFDTRYFLYYEDVDLCARLRLAGYEIALCPDAQVIHHAHRSSHRSIKYFKWHLSSMLRFFCSPVYWRVQSRKWF